MQIFTGFVTTTSFLPLTVIWKFHYLAALEILVHLTMYHLRFVLYPCLFPFHSRWKCVLLLHPHQHLDQLQRNSNVKWSKNEKNEMKWIKNLRKKKRDAIKYSQMPTRIKHLLFFFAHCSPLSVSLSFVLAVVALISRVCNSTPSKWLLIGSCCEIEIDERNAAERVKVKERKRKRDKNRRKKNFSLEVWL